MRTNCHYIESASHCFSDISAPKQYLAGLAIAILLWGILGLGTVLAG